VDQVSGWVRVRVRNVSFPFGKKLYTCKNLPKVDENRSTIPSIFGSRTYLVIICPKDFTFSGLHVQISTSTG